MVNMFSMGMMGGMSPMGMMGSGNVHQQMKMKYGVGPDLRERPVLATYPMEILPPAPPPKKGFLGKIIQKLYG
ncbi:MAG: hypothetical protein E7Z89_05295 [Cyanobacteria bacterium SIG28]|nr:hypothetical protein [Cyanobacteria bacterium SIG28]